MELEIYTAPEKFTYLNGKEIYPSIFLAGTIDNGNSLNWQQEFINKLKSVDNSIYEKLMIFNPRRDDWDPDFSYEDQITQIKWEHEYLDLCDTIIMNILPDSKSPISLMEIGLYAESKKLIVFCNEEFYRYANVKCVCDKYNIPLYNTNVIDDIIEIINKI